MNIDEIRIEFLKLVEADPKSIPQLAIEVGFKCRATMEKFIKGNNRIQFKQLMMIKKWIDQKKK